MSRRLFHALRELRHSERGIALPMALMITVVAMGFAAVPVVASINAQSGDSHNQGTNEALAAAEAGAELAVLRQSTMLSSASTGRPACAEGTPQIQTGADAGWCSQYPSATTHAEIGNAEYSYQVNPCYSPAAQSCTDVPTAETCSAAENLLLVQIVSTGYATVAGQEVTRRIELTACAETNLPPAAQAKEREIESEKVEETTKINEKTALEEKQAAQKKEVISYTKEVRELEETIERVKSSPEGVESEPGPEETYFETVKTAPPNVWADGQIVGIEGLNMNNNAQVYNGGAGSNKEVKLTGSANVCGSVFYGTVFYHDNSSSEKAPSGCAAGRTATKGTISYPAITLPGSIATENSDSRLCKEAACHEGEDPVPSSVWQRGNLSYNASNKQLTVNYSSLTLEGTKPYYLCQLILAGGSSLYAGTGKSITIYFAPPSACPGLNGAAQLQIANGTYVYADASSGPKFLFVGNSSNPAESKIELAGGAKSEQFVIYAPDSKVTANNGIEMTGAIIANSLELAGGASLNKYGAFTAPPSESFLTSTETKVEKKRPGTPVTKPSKYLKELETRKTTTESTIAKIDAEITSEQSSISKISSEITTISNKIASDETEYWSDVSAGGGTGKALEKKSFSECTAAPPATGLKPDEGC